MAILLSKNIAQCDDRARRPRGVTTELRSVGFGLVEILSWMRHWRYGLECKPAERVADGARVLGLEVWGKREELRWKRNNAFGEVPDTLTRRSVFSFCGKLIGHLPVCGWLRVATAFMKRRANSSTSTWDEEIYDESLRAMMEDTVRRVRETD